jgi:small-conductance mechanosensitive channel
MDALLAQARDVAVTGLLRLVVVVLVSLVLFAVYRVVVASVRRVAAHAVARDRPSDRTMAPDDQAIHEATRRRRIETLVIFGTRLARIVLFVTIAFAAAETLLPGIIDRLGSLGVALGVAVGGAIGFGAQQLVRDYLNGVLLLGENPFGVGDVVAIAGIQGTVEEVGLRRTVVRDADGAVHSVPNSEIRVASNFTRTYARLNERFTVAPGTDIGRAVAVLEMVCAALVDDDAWRDRFSESPRVLRVDAAVAGEPGIPILVTATVRPGEQWEVAGELRRRALTALREARLDLAAGRTLVVSRDSRWDGEPGQDADGGADFT